MKGELEVSISHEQRHKNPQWISKLSSTVYIMKTCSFNNNNNTLFYHYCAQTTMLSSLLVSSHLILTSTLWDRNIFTFYKWGEQNIEDNLPKVTHTHQRWNSFWVWGHSLNYYIIYKSLNTENPEE